MTFVLWVTLTFSLIRRGTGLFWVTYPSWRVILRFWKIPHNEGEALRIDGVDWQYGRDRAPQESETVDVAREEVVGCWQLQVELLVGSQVYCNRQLK